MLKKKLLSLIGNKTRGLKEETIKREEMGRKGKKREEKGIIGNKLEEPRRKRNKKEETGK